MVAVFTSDHRVAAPGSDVDFPDPAAAARETRNRKPLLAAVLPGVVALAVGAVFGTPAPAQPQGGPTPSPPGASVYFIDIKDGAVIPPTTTIHFGLRGMG